ncbi:MAG: GIY-YIG nuclease family protein [Ferruginibacter sp.]
MPFTYILYSGSLQKFYFGSTSLTVDERLLRHLSMHKGFTAKANDWKIVFKVFYETLSDARKREIQLKKWKSHLRIQQLIDRSSPDCHRDE